METELGHGTWHPTKDLLLVSSQDTIRLWDIKQSSIVAEYPLSELSRQPSWSSSGSLIAVWGESLIILNEQLEVVAQLEDDMLNGSWNSEEKLLLQGKDYGYIWDPITNKTIMIIDDISPSSRLLWHPDGKSFVFWDSDDSFQLWDQFGRITHFDNPSPLPESFGNHGRWSYDGQYFIYFTLDLRALVFQIESGAMIHEIVHESVPSDTVGAFYLSGMLNHDNSQIATISNNNLRIQILE